MTSQLCQTWASSQSATESANDRDGPGQNTALVERKLYDELNEYGEGHFDEPNEEDPQQ
jgi:hypothetical protein